MSQHKDADAFDDLLGQLVDELAMTPTVEPEPEPEPPPPVAHAMPGAPAGGMPAGHPGMAGHADPAMAAAYMEPPQPKSNGLAIAGIIAGAIIVVGIAAVFILKPAEPAPTAAAEPKAQKAEVKAPAEPPPPPPGATPPATAPVAAPGQPGAPVAPGATPPVGAPTDPAAVPPPADPNAAPAATPSKPAPKKSAKKKKASGGSAAKAKPKGKSSFDDL